jgi:hypothetical protein
VRKIVSLFATEDFHLKLEFDDGTAKMFNMETYFKLPVFSILSNPILFKQVTNRSYYIEWPGQQIDLSADTLWHGGEIVSKDLFLKEPVVQKTK